MLVAFNTAWSDNCVQLDNDEDRLACFDKARTCVELQSASDRLACFDAAYAEKQSAPFSITATPEEFADDSDERRHKEVIRTTIVRVTRDRYKIDYLFLENGHVWRENKNTRVRFEPGREVVIEEGILGSFNLSMQDEDRTVKVKRVK